MVTSSAEVEQRAATTRPPGARFQAQGGVSTTHARLALDGPIGRTGVGYLLSVRSGLPNLLAPARDPSYLRGETDDWLAKLEGVALGGRLRALAYGSRNEIRASAEPASDAAAGGSSENGLRTGARTTTTIGVRVQVSRTSYRSGADTGSSWSLIRRTTVAALFAGHGIGITPSLHLTASAAALAAAGALRFGPRGQLRWRASERVTLWSSYTRTHQFVQSLRNPASVVGTVFPADLFVAADGAGVPVARSDQGVVASTLLGREAPEHIARGGRKAHRLA